MNFFGILSLSIRLQPNLKCRKKTQKRLNSKGILPLLDGACYAVRTFPFSGTEGNACLITWQGMRKNLLVSKVLKKVTVLAIANTHLYVFEIYNFVDYWRRSKLYSEFFQIKKCFFST